MAFRAKRKALDGERSPAKAAYGLHLFRSYGSVGLRSVDPASYLR